MENNETHVFDYLLELDNGDIVQDVKSNKDNFSWHNLCKFSKAVEETLSSNGIYEVLNADEVSDSYFKNYIDVRIPDQLRIRNDRHLGPIPQFYQFPSKSSDILRLADADSSYLITPKERYYSLYLAFKLALIPPGSFFSLLEYQERHFENQKTYLEILQFLVADFSDILGNRQLLIKSYLDRQSIQSLDTPKPDTETIHNVQHRLQVIAINALLEEVYKHRENKPEKKTIAKFILFVTGKNSGKRVQGTNAYKWISKPLVLTEDKNVNNYQKIRYLFEELLLTDIAEGFTKEIKRSNFI